MTWISLKNKASKQGFTLAESMITMTVFGIVIAGTMSFFIYSMNFASYGMGKLTVNRDMRAFTSEMSQNATYANSFNIYTSFTDRTKLADGLSGDFLLLVYRDPNNNANISRIIGYYRQSPDAASLSPVYTFDQSYSPSTSTIIENLLPDTSAVGTHEELVELSRGLSNGKLFYNFFDRSIMIKGEFNSQGSLSKDATNTYNFTISPRG